MFAFARIFCFIWLSLQTWTAVAFIIYGRDVIVYYEEGFSIVKSYHEAKSHCQLLGGRLPNSLEELKKYDFHSQFHQTSQFWLGPVKEVSDDIFTWPSGHPYRGDKSDWVKLSNVNCKVNCCALTAMSVLDSNVRVTVKGASECQSHHRQLCIITNAPGKMIQKLNQIHLYMKDANESVEEVKSQLNQLKSVKSNLTVAVTDLTESMKRSNLQFMKSTSSSSSSPPFVYFSGESNSASNSESVSGDEKNDDDENGYIEKEHDHLGVASSRISSFYQLKPNDPDLIQAEDGSWFYFNGSRGSLEETQHFCSTLGASIPTIHSKNESAFLTSIIGFSSSLWLAGKRESVHEPFYWMDDSPFNYTPWALSYPSCESSCCGIQLSSRRFTFGEIFDTDCSLPAYQVCKVTHDNSAVRTRRLNEIENQVYNLQKTVTQQNYYIGNMTSALNNFFQTLNNLLKTS